MIAFRKAEEAGKREYANCHDGKGIVNCLSLLDGVVDSKFRYMHCDHMDAGVSIGSHLHTGSEEIYYLISGKGILTFDDQTYEMQPGDVSLCTSGHSHGFLATEDSILIVIG